MTETLTAILVIITAYYAWQTRQSVKVMEESSLPHVSVYLDNEPSHITDIYMVIRNDGDRAAFDLKLEVISGDIAVTEGPTHDTSQLSDMLFMKSNLAVLPPRNERRHLIITTTPTIWGNIQNEHTTIKISYRDKKGSEYNHEFDLDYTSLPFSGTPRNSTYQKPEKSLQNIDNSLKKIAQRVAGDKQ